MFKLFLDPGHGGTDSGAVGNGIMEKNITLQIALKIRDILSAEYSDVSILMSRTADTFPSLSDRTNAANSWGADYFLSIHINAGGGTGFESYVYPGVGAPTTTYQSTIHSEVMKLNQLTDRGKKQSDLHVLRESNMPALLTENGFIDNGNDAAKMQSATWIENVARGHVNGLASTFNLQKKSGAVYHTVVSGDTVYSLSRQYGSTIDQIKTWNNLDDNYTIYVGQVLRVK
ncbi:N-acetylmuramoyl-L-alanine amidase [Heyndrickxia sp. NPDC080065]|uniref:N-acetylmuramoyl-L-alanine amidase n=1 Tax=Heyndrickxia sp. NPDC080065 TaxID=3390568 RepID=UPI003D057430